MPSAPFMDTALHIDVGMLPNELPKRCALRYIGFNESR